MIQVYQDFLHVCPEFVDLLNRCVIRQFLRGHKHNIVCSESRCALRLGYVDLVVSIEVAVEVCCCFTVFSC
jgi:hypothetical protein